MREQALFYVLHALGVSPDNFGSGLPRMAGVLLCCGLHLLLQCLVTSTRSACASAMSNQTAVATGTAALQLVVAAIGKAVAAVEKAVAFGC